MTVTVKHSKVSTVPDSSDTSLVRPSDWNADHTLSGLGTAAELNAGVANGVASLDSAGKVPISQIPDSVIGALSYQGTWNASTNTPTLISSTGTKGYYYVVSVAGTTNLDGITDWKVGDWAVYNGTTWQKIDNTDSVTSVNGYTGAVVLTQPDISGTANAPVNTNITSMTGITGGISSPNYVQFNTSYATGLTAGQLGWDGHNTLAVGMAGGNVTQHIGEDLFFYIKASSAITKGQVVMFTGAVGASGVATGAPATGVTDGTYIMGVAAESIANNGFGLVQAFGEVTNVNTTGYADGDILWYDPSVTGGLTKTKPSAPNIKVQMAAVINGGSAGGGVIFVRVSAGSTLGGTDSNAQITSPSNGQMLTYDGTNAYWKNTALGAGTGISVGASTTGVLTVTNSAPDQTVAITGAGGAVVTGTYPNFTITTPSGTVTNVTASAPMASTGGATPNLTITKADATHDGYLSSTDWNTFNSKGSGTVTSVSGTAPISSTGGATPAISISQATTSTNGYLSSTDWNTFNNKQPAGAYLTTVTADSPLTGSGTSASHLSIPAATSSVNGYLTSTDWTTFNNKGSVTSVSGTSPISVATGTTTPAISLSSGYGDTQNPYASKTANYVLAAPNGSAGVPSFRALVAADIPTLNQNTTGSAGSVTNALTAGTGLKLSSGTTYNGSAALTINAVGTTLNSQTSAYVVAATDAGKLISITTGGVTVNNSVMSAGDIVTIYNNSGSSQTITQGTGVTLQWAGQSASTTGNRTLGLYGMATVVFISASNAVITGSGLT